MHLRDTNACIWYTQIPVTSDVALLLFQHSGAYVRLTRGFRQYVRIP